MFKFLVIFALALYCQVHFTEGAVDENIRYFVYTQARQNIARIVNVFDFTPMEMQRDGPIVILIHGHQGSALKSFSSVVKDAFFGINLPFLNVIVVDWSPYADGSYSNSVDIVTTVAENMKAFIKGIEEQNNAANDARQWNLEENVHIVGFDLGAHIAGIAARNFNKIGRITGLDPSGKKWGAKSSRLRLSDANYVEVIHTDGGNSVLANGLGDDIGHVDFFANGGTSQPGCFSHTCCHERAYELFASSLTNLLEGQRCSTSLQNTLNLCKGVDMPLGNHIVKKEFTSGIYRINTKKSYPF